MTEFGRFLVKHWDLLVVGVSCLVSIILLFVRKRPNARSFLQYVDAICTAIPKYVLEAEKTGLRGEEKKQIVIKKCLSQLHSLLKCSEEEDAQASLLFGEQIEEVLDTPRKK